MHCRVIIGFRSKLGIKQHDITLTIEKTVLRAVMDAFQGENMQF